MKNLKFVMKEHKENIYKMWKLAWYDFVAPLRDTYLGPVWMILGPLLQIAVYWLVFGTGIRQGRPVDGNPFLLWMLSGLVPWFYINGGINGGATCIYGKATLLTKMKFPVSIIPTYTTLTKLISNLPVLLILLIVYAFYGYKVSIHIIQLPYYIIASTILVISITMLTSALVMAIRDINRIIGTIMRFIFYLTPILWVPRNLPWAFDLFIKVNPLTYIIEGFRNSLLYKQWFFYDMKGTIWFWFITLVILMLGINIHMKFRDKFADMI